MRRIWWILAMKIITIFTENEKISDIVARQKHPAGPAGCQSINYFNRCLLLVCAGPRMSTNNKRETKITHNGVLVLKCWLSNSVPAKTLLHLTSTGGRGGAGAGARAGVVPTPTSIAPLLANRLHSQEGDLSQKLLNQKKKWYRLFQDARQDGFLLAKGHQSSDPKPVQCGHSVQKSEAEGRTRGSWLQANEESI